MVTAPVALDIPGGPAGSRRELVRRCSCARTAQPGKPIQNALVESFNARFRDECLNEHWFLSLDDARQRIEGWRRDHNSSRPHRSLGQLTPEEYAGRFASLQAPPAPSGTQTMDGMAS